ncbi:MAG: argS [Candidatus Saccharibacteria bacterium]|nr:argS [Candidatus Saccharibacteria bacterium]
MKERFELAIQAVVADLFNQTVTIELTRPDEQFGDYATNVALQLAKPLNQNPRQVAETIADAIREKLSGSTKEVTVAGPGFINLTVADPELLRALDEPFTQTYAGQNIIAEYSDPNPFKPLHAGHLYTTLVGDSIARLIEAGGANLTRLNYGGDVGLHAAKNMWAICKYFGGETPEKLAEIDPEHRADWLGERYVEGNTAYEDDEAAKLEIIEYNKRIYGLHDSGDHASPFARIYWTCREWSYEYFAKLYEQLGVKPFNRMIPESEVTPLGLATVKEQLEKGVYTQSDGAVVFKGEPFGLHTRVFINSQGLPTYETKDVGLLLTKWQDYHFDRSLIITANEQSQYMEVVYKSIEQFAPEPVSRSQHLTHGVVKLTGGVKMSSRKGNTVQAVDILAAATTAAQKISDKASYDTVLAAVKYAFIKPRIGGDIIYDPLESVSLEGNSGPYLQYAHARACSILAKAEAETTLTGELDAAERSLVRKLTEYQEVVNRSVAELLPHHICTYLYELAQDFNRFYEHNRVIGDPRQTVRLALVRQYATVLHGGLTLLGIPAPTSM